MADQLRTTEGELTERAFPPKDFAYWLGTLLNWPVSDIPTVEDWQREQGQIGLPTETQTARQSGQGALDYTTQFLGPLMALLGSQQYARQGSGKPAPTWGKQTDFTKPNSPLEQLLNWRRTKPWENQPPTGESAWQYRNPPPIGGPTGKGQTPVEVRAAIEQDRFRGMLKQIREQEALETQAELRRQLQKDQQKQRDWDVMTPPQQRLPGGARREDFPVDEALEEWLRRNPPGGANPGGPFTLPPLPGD